MKRLFHFGALAFLAVGIGACGKKSEQPISRVGLGYNDPVAGTPGGNTGSTVLTTRLIATPSSSVSVNTTVTITPTNDNYFYDFSMDQSVAGLRFVGASSNVRQAYVTSSVPVTVRISAVSVSPETYGQQRSVSVTFTGSTTPVVTPVSYPTSGLVCRVTGPFYSEYASYGSLYSWSGNPQVGDAPLFSVSDSFGNPVQVINVGSQDTQETARYFYRWDRFTFSLLSGGSKTVFVRARSFSTGELCEAQITFAVTSPVLTPVNSTGFCGIYPATGLGVCTQIVSDSYYYDGRSCRYLLVSSGCAARGAFSSYSDCERTVNSRYCQRW